MTTMVASARVSSEVSRGGKVEAEGGDMRVCIDN